MKRCGGCGGVLGRDCYNEQECVQITQSMQHQDGGIVVTLTSETYISGIRFHAGVYRITEERPIIPCENPF